MWACISFEVSGKMFSRGRGFSGMSELSHEFRGAGFDDSQEGVCSRTVTPLTIITLVNNHDDAGWRGIGAQINTQTFMGHHRAQLLG